MYFQQFYLSCLAHASYMLGSDGAAAVVDPQRDVEIYLEEAERQGLKIAYVIETHLHADFVSGHRELAERTGATIYLGAKAGATFPHVGAKEGDEIRVGRCVLGFIETPGHTPESMCVLVTDLERGPEPWAVLTGDTLFIGDVGRPDLSPGFTPQEMAGSLYDSLHNKLLTLPDSVEVYPAHGAGSMCGRNISPERVSTIGKERAMNYALKPMSRGEFVVMLTAELPARPEYFSRDAEINRAGAPALAALPPLPGLSPEELRARQTAGAVVLDTRPPTQFGGGHVPASINIPLSGQYATWAASLIGLDLPILLVAEDPEQLEESRMRLARVGMEKVEGYLEGGVLAWEKAGLKLGEVPQISVLDLYKELNERAGELQVVDVRRPAEWEAGHIEQATLRSLDNLPAPAAKNGGADVLAGLDAGKTVAVHCKSGYRSAIACSLLGRAGFKNVINIVGGFDAWQKQQLPIVGDTAATSCAR